MKKPILLKRYEIKHFSFLLGSGFSIPFGYYSSTDLNNILKSIKKEEIQVHTSGTARFLFGEKDPNGWFTRTREKRFVEEFLNFYNKEVLTGEEFNYERFFDFYTSLRRGEGEIDSFNKFVNKFNKTEEFKYNGLQLLFEFDEIFQQLLAQLLTKWVESVSYVEPYHSQYSGFFYLLKELSQNFKIHIHTLNHDLLMEQFAHSDVIGKDFSDGFEEIGSSFYGEYSLITPVRELDKIINKSFTYTVRLRLFTDDFSKRFCLYKLHGSIDNYAYNLSDDKFETIKLLRGVNPFSLFHELKKDDKLVYESSMIDPYPEFLSGTSEKTRFYSQKRYFEPIFSHFKTNLENSNYLIIIGYGCGDDEINKLVLEHFLSKENSKAVMIGRTKPNCEIANHDKVKYYDCGIAGLDLNEIKTYFDI